MKKIKKTICSQLIFPCMLLMLTSILLTACQPKQNPAITPETNTTTQSQITNTSDSSITSATNTSVMPTPSPLPTPTATPISATVSTDTTFPPFVLVESDTNTLIGYDIDLISVIAQKTNLEIAITNTTYDQAIRNVETCTSDIAIAHIIGTTDENPNILYSEPYIDAGQIVTVKTDNISIRGKEDLNGKNIGYIEGTMAIYEINTIPESQPVLFDDYSKAFMALLNGEIEAVISPEPIAEYYIREHYNLITTRGEKLTKEEYCIAICNQKPELQTLINQGLHQVNKEGLLVMLERKWIASSPSHIPTEEE